MPGGQLAGSNGLFSRPLQKALNRGGERKVGGGGGGAQRATSYSSEGGGK